MSHNREALMRLRVYQSCHGNRTLMRTSTLIGMAFLVLGLSACDRQDDVPGVSNAVVREVESLFADTARAEIALSPETATRMGLDTRIAGVDFKHTLDDRSQARFERTRLLRLELLERLKRIPALPADSDISRDLGVVRTAYEAITTLEAFGYGRYQPAYARPYVIDHLSGAWIDVPELLISRQTIRSRDDVMAYLDRLSGLASAVADERRRLESDAANGIRPPRAILERTHIRVAGFAAIPAGEHPLVLAFENMITSVDALDGPSRLSLSEQAQEIMDDEVLPAYVALADTLGTLAVDAREDPSVSALPNGDAYYRAILAFHITPDISTDVLHEEGLRVGAELKAELGAELDAAGIPAGTLAERIAILNQLPGQIYEDSPEGRATLLLRIDGIAAEATAALPRLIDRAPKDGVLMTRMAGFQAVYSGGASYDPATADGRLPSRMKIDLRDMNDWPDFSLPTLVHHEAVPGHHTQMAVTSAYGQLRLIRQLFWNTAFGEGWAVYAEDLADETGLNADIPYARIGYLQSVLLRAARLVVDTGIHARGWSRERALTYLVETTGMPRDLMEEEVDRITVWPGHAAAYLAGRDRLLELRERARAVLDNEFDLAAFNSVILEGGPRPIPMVEADIEGWYGRVLEQD